MDKARIDKVLAPVDAAEHDRRESTVRRAFLDKARAVASRVPFMEDIAAAYFCAIDDKTPTRVRGILVAALAYFVLPLDFIPDFLIVVGFTDDVAVATAAIATVKPHIKKRHYDRARSLLANEPAASGQRP